MKVPDDRADQSLLLAHGLRIEIGVGAAENFGKKREKSELHGEAVFASGHQIGFQGAQGAVIGPAGLVAEFVPTGPPAGANHVEASGVNQSHVAVPDVDIRMIEIEALNFAGHVRGANNGERLVVELEVIGVNRKAWTGAEIGFIANPESGVVDLAGG